jgi:hypothetical protein
MTRHTAGARALVAVGALDLLLIAGGMAAVVYGKQSMAWYAYAVIAVALVTFFGFLWIGFEPEAQPTISAASMRNAITASVVALYLALVGFTTFFRDWSDTMQPLTQTMVSNFTTLVGVVLAFYFTSSAYVETRRAKRSPNDPSGNTQ